MNYKYLSERRIGTEKVILNDTIETFQSCESVDLLALALIQICNTISDHV